VSLVQTESLRRDQAALMHELEAAGATFKGLRCNCPFHEDRNPSAEIFEATDGVWRFKCYGGACGFHGDIFEVRGQREGKGRKQLIAEVEAPTNGNRARPEPPARPLPKKEPPRAYASIEDAAKSYGEWSEVQGVYPYTNPVTGKPDCWVMRHWPKGESRKFFAQFTPLDDGRVLGQGPPVPWPIFNRKRVLEAACVIVVEGEKCVAALHEKTGIVATTGMGGAGNGKAEKHDWTPLSGKRVWLWPDNDADGGGQRHMAAVEKELMKLPLPPKEIILIDPALMLLGDKQDAADFCATLEGTKEENAEITWQTIHQCSTVRGPLADYFNRVERIKAGKFRAIAFPFRRLSQMTNALQPGTVTMFVGAAGSNKSFFILFCLIFWLRRGVPCSVLEIEDERGAHLQRAVAILAQDGRMGIPGWCEEHPQMFDDANRAHYEELVQIGQCIHVAEDGVREKRMTMGEALLWVEARCKAGDRIITVDPVTLLEKGAPPWEADPAFIDRCKKLASLYQCSIILVAHPAKGKSRPDVLPDIGDVAGGAVWEQAAHNFLWMTTCYPEATSMVRENREDMPFPVTHNRVIHLLKARNGTTGAGPRFAVQFSTKTLGFLELGVIEPAQKKKAFGK